MVALDRSYRLSRSGRPARGLITTGQKAWQELEPLPRKLRCEPARRCRESRVYAPIKPVASLLFPGGLEKFGSIITHLRRSTKDAPGSTTAGLPMPHAESALHGVIRLDESAKAIIPLHRQRKPWTCTCIVRFAASPSADELMHLVACRATQTSDIGRFRHLLHHCRAISSRTGGEGPISELLGGLQSRYHPSEACAARQHCRSGWPLPWGIQTFLRTSLLSDRMI